jgi:cytochrome P450
LSLVFAAVGNSTPSAFWILASVLSDPEALAALQSEVDSFSCASEKDADFTVEQLEKCVTMQSMWTEALRLYYAGFTVRDVVKDMVVEMDAQREGGPTTFVLKKGSRLMAFAGIRHTDPDIFENPDMFVWNRFLPDPTTGEAPVFTTKDGLPLKGEPVIAFGGGAHRCPGRRFIENEVKSLLAYMFTKFELRLAEGESVPGKHLPTQGLGVSFPDREMYIEIRAKKPT